MAVETVPPEVDHEARPGGSRRRLLILTGIALLAVGVAAAVLTGEDEPASGPPPAELAPETTAFVADHDAAAEALADDRAAVADQSGDDASPESLLELVAVLEAAQDHYAALDTPDWMAADVQAYLAALEAEREATAAAYEALQSGEDARLALQRVLDERTRADNLREALRGTAVMHPAGR